MEILNNSFNNPIHLLNNLCFTGEYMAKTGINSHKPKTVPLFNKRQFKSLLRSKLCASAEIRMRMAGMKSGEFGGGKPC